MSDTADNSKKFTGKHMLIIMICLFGVVISVNVTMAIIASQSWTGLVVKNSYVESQKFNTYLNEAEKQKKLGWKSDLKHKKGIVTLTFQDSSGKSLDNLDVTVIAERPTHENEDRVLKFSLQSEGSYSHNSALPAGYWNLKLVARALDKQLYRQVYQIKIE